MLLVFNKMHANHFREKDLKNLKNELGSKNNNATQLTFSYGACINGRFERKLQRFIDRLPFVYFSVSCDSLPNKDANKPLRFEQGLCSAKDIKNFILKWNKRESPAKW